MAGGAFSAVGVCVMSGKEAMMSERVVSVSKVLKCWQVYEKIILLAALC